MEAENTFYCIKLINSNGERGWLWDSPDGIKIIKGLHSDITQFETEKDALAFIRERKLERKGVKAYVRTNQEIIEDSKKVETVGISSIDKPLFYLENQNGKKCFYDSKIDGYFFKQMGDSGFPIWYDEESITKFVRVAEFEEGMIFIIKKEGNKKQRKLIQAYGIKEGDEGIQSTYRLMEMNGKSIKLKNKNMETS